MNKGPFLVTTPIYYVNDVPHIGHAYTTVAADVLARFQRLIGREVFFLTGTDEHGKKIEQAAQEKGMKPRELADQVSRRFVELWEKLEISHDRFIRTTDPEHIRGVQHFWKQVEKNGQIHPGEYEGLYCTGCEAYFTEKELDEGLLCPIHKKPVQRLKESSYFFRMSEHGSWLHSYIIEHPEFIQPESRRNEILSFVGEGLRDLSISRTSFSWGIPVPGDEKHVVYVWFDALLNYMTALGYPDGKNYKRFWGKDAEVVHLVGKDILRFHTVYWPTMLHAAGHRQPSTVYAHGWWNVEGRKMSKSLRNVVDPVRLVERYGVDEVRYFLLREVPFGDDGNFTHEALAGRILGELANTVGNLANRVIPLVRKNFPMPDSLCRHEKKPIPELEQDWEGPKTAFGAYCREMDQLSFSQAIEEILALARSTNDFIQRGQPWKLLKEGRYDEAAWMFEHCLEALTTIAVGLYPFMPNRMDQLWHQLGHPDEIHRVKAHPEKGVEFTIQPQVGEAKPLFAKREEVEAARDAFLAEVEKAPGLAPASGQATGEGPEGLARIGFEEFMNVELRVGRIDAAFAVPKSDKLLRLDVNLGGEERQIVAGIAKHYKPDDLIRRRVVVVANLKPAKLMGIESQGMILAAEGEDGQLFLIDPGEDARVGARVK